MSGFSLADHLFNAKTVGQLAHEYSNGVPGFDGARFQKDALAGFPDRALLERMEHIADCVEAQLASDFPTMADQLEAAMPARLDPSKTDDDFGHFIHGIPGILAVRHGLENHRDRALDLIYEATQRFSMEFYIRPFLNRWQDETLARLAAWAADENYHVRRLVSEGTRPKLPWAKAVTLTTDQTVPLLGALHADSTRYVTRSVSNHLNDIAKNDPDLVITTLKSWGKGKRQTAKEMDWMTRHALRTLVKDGHAGALKLLGYRTDVPLTASLEIPGEARIDGTLSFDATITAPEDLPVLVDYAIWFRKKDGKQSPKVFKLKVANAKAGKPLTLKKIHKLKGNATTFSLHPGAHKIALQVNGKVVAEADFDLLPAT